MSSPSLRWTTAVGIAHAEPSGTGYSITQRVQNQTRMVRNIQLLAGRPPQPRPLPAHRSGPWLCFCVSLTARERARLPSGSVTLLGGEAKGGLRRSAVNGHSKGGQFASAVTYRPRLTKAELQQVQHVVNGHYPVTTPVFTTSISRIVWRAHEHGSHACFRCAPEFTVAAVPNIQTLPGCDP